MGQFPRRLRRDPADVPRRDRNRSAHRQEALLVEHVDRRRRLRRALPRRAALRAFRRRLAVAAGADRRDRAVDDLGRGRLRGDDRDRVQQHRDRQDHSRRLLHQRSRHGAGARRRVRALRPLAAPVRRRHRGRARCARALCAVDVQEPRATGERAANEVRFAHSAGARRNGVGGGERGGPARLSRGHGARADISRRTRTAAPDAHHRILDPDPILFPEGGIAGRSARRRRVDRAHRGLSRHQDGDQVHRHSAADPLSRIRPARGDVHDASDVDRAHLRLDLRAVRADQQDHRPDPIYDPRHRRHRQRRRADADRADLVPARISSRSPTNPRCWRRRKPQVGSRD